MRFETFVLAHELKDKSILDVGCGVGDFWEHLQRRSISCEYVGVDISTQMIRRCKERFPLVDFETGDLSDWEPGRQFDYTVAFGIHNVKVLDGWETLRLVTRKQFDLCKIAAHLSLLTDRFSGFAPHIQAWHVEDVLALALEITPFVVLRHDYLPNDFSVTLYRQPLIDTRKDLILD